MGAEIVVDLCVNLCFWRTLKLHSTCCIITEVRESIIGMAMTWCEIFACGWLLETHGHVGLRRDVGRGELAAVELRGNFDGTWKIWGRLEREIKLVEVCCPLF